MTQDDNKKNKFSEFVDHNFNKAILIIIAAVISFSSSGILAKMDEMSTKLEALNTNIVKIIVEQTNQKEDITDLKSRVLFLERKNK